ncbi:hypothetical protein [Coprobacter sp.]
MEAEKEKLYNDITNVFTDVIEKVSTDENCSLTDVYVCVKFDDLSLVVYDDAENVLLQTSIDGWNDLKENSENFEDEVIDSLKYVLNTDDIKQKFEAIDFAAPFSVILVDDDFEQICELATYDKDTIYLEDNFFDKMDKELDEFFEKLMSDVQ